MIAGLLAELDRLLPAGTRRRRVLLEAEDHLRCAVAAGIAAGLDPEAAEAAAVRDFGSPERLARTVREQLGAGAATMAARLGLALLGALAAVYALRFTELANDRGQPRWWPDEPLLSLISLLAIEVAVVAGAVIMVRLLRHRSGSVTGAVRAPLLRGILVATGAGAVAALSDGIAAVRHLDAVRSSHLALAVVGLGLAILLLAVATAATGLRGLLVAGSQCREPHPVDDLLGLARPVTGWLEPWALRHRGLVGLVDLRSHPWRACACLAAVVGALQTAGLWWRDGTDAIPGGVVQAMAVVAFFALFGPVLGLRRRRVTPAAGPPAAPVR